VGGTSSGGTTEPDGDDSSDSGDGLLGLPSLSQISGMVVKSVKNGLTAVLPDFILNVTSFKDSVIHSVKSAIFGTLPDLILNFDEMLWRLIVPDSQFFADKFESVLQLFNDKFAFDEIKNVIGVIKNLDNLNNEQPFDFTFKLPEEWGGASVVFFDKGVYDVYKPQIFGIMRVLMWGGFLWRTYKKLPGYIDGGIKT